MALVEGLDDEGEAEDAKAGGDDAPETGAVEAQKEAFAKQGAKQDADGSEGDPAGEVGHVPEGAAGLVKVNGESGEVDKEAGGRGGGDEGAGTEVKRKQGAGPQAALVPGDAAEEAGEESKPPDGRPPGPPVRGPIAQDDDGGEEQQFPKHEGEHGAAEPGVKQGPGEPARGTHQPEAAEDGPIDIPPQAPEPECGGRGVRQGDGSDGRAGANFHGKKRREHAADPKTGEGGGGPG